ncbi:MAG: YggS family pyridoxal phosphate-dependent enzyme [Deltaproteobacteria bacterium]|nr:MAG: YggS family pyridoxal phosphate-dependent enzyme [Deltaproteobacteria bacterium]RLB01520.1 MAG: YggS family pyridoxal phosphate-dependent enzyme [Deltaproteobacteria bacterium]
MGGQVRDNLLRVLERMEKAALRVGRRPEEVRLVGATKGVDVDRIAEAVESGLEIVGENYVQEALRKREVLGDRVRWHMIGHLQRNKARHAVGLFEMIHSVDSLKLAQELQKRAAKEGREVEVLLQVNLSGEETKSGVAPEGVQELAEAISEMPNLRLKGLMTMPPYFEDPDGARPYFQALRRLRDELQRRGLPVEELSMGMSADFEVAIEEGATLVRVGTAIFGQRRP